MSTVSQDNYVMEMQVRPAEGMGETKDNVQTAKRMRWGRLKQTSIHAAIKKNFKRVCRTCG